MTMTSEIELAGNQPLKSRRCGAWLKLALAVGVIITAITVNYVSHLNRSLFSDYQMRLQVRDQLDVEWGQLLLEQSAFAAHSRVEQIAIKKLGMHAPDSDEIVMVQQ
jgi:cell division protein FtsL